MNYLIFATYEEVNAAVQAIMEDKYDFIVVYNGNYDSRMHRAGLEDMHIVHRYQVYPRKKGE